MLDAVRLKPGADVAAVTTAQLRELVDRLVAAGQWKPGDPEVLVVLDAGYDAPRIAHPLHDLPGEILGWFRSDRVMRRPTPPRVYDSKGGWPPKCHRRGLQPSVPSQDRHLTSQGKGTKPRRLPN